MTVPAQTTPQFTQGGTAFGRTAAQWNAYFAAKVDAQNGSADQLSLTSPIINGIPFPDAPIVTVDVPLTLSAQGELGLSYGSGLTVNSGTLGLSLGSGLIINGNGALAIGTGAVANGNLVQVPPHSYIGNNTASIAAAGYITNTQLTADLNLATSSVQGLIPKLSGSAGQFFSGGTGGFTAVPYSSLSQAGSQLSGLVNVGLTATVSGNALTVTLTDATGNPLSASNPALITMRNPTALTSGVPLQLSITTPLSVTVPSGATLGASNGSVPFRIWTIFAYDGTTAQIAVIICSNPATPSAGIQGLSEHEPFPTTAITSGATALQTVYAPGTTAASMARVIGWMNWNTGLATAGTWASGPSTLSIKEPGTAFPGQPTGTVAYGTDSTSTTTSTANTPTALTLSIKKFAVVNWVRVRADGKLRIQAAAAGDIGTAQIVRVTGGATGVGSTMEVEVGATAAESIIGSGEMMAFEAVNSTAAITYTVYISGSANVASAYIWNVNTTPTTIFAEEIQG